MQLATGENPVSPTPQPAPSHPLAPHGPGAWEPLTLESAFDAHHDLIFRVAYRMTGNAHDAEDVLQTVFLRLAARDAQSAGIENAESYLRRAAVHASLNLLELKSRKDIPLEGLPEPVGRADQRDLREVLRLAIGKLDRRSAEMFICPPLHRRAFESRDRRNVRRLNPGGGSHTPPCQKTIAKGYS